MVLRPVSLALCDGFAAKKFVSTSGSSVSALTALPEFRTFKEMATKKDFDLLRRLEGIYEETIKTGCSFSADAFGGHCLITVKSIPKNFVFPYPLCLVAKIKPEEEHLFDDISTIAATKLCQFPRLLAGSFRFVNSSCDPNCRYEFTSSDGSPCVKLKTLRAIQSGEELTVFNGEEFFESSECRCPQWHLHKHLSEEATIQRLSLPYSLPKKYRRPRISLSGFLAISGAETGNSYKRKRTMLMGTFCKEDLRLSPFDESSTSSSEESHCEEQLSVVKTVPVGSSTPIHQTTEPVCPGFYDECDELFDHPSSSSESYSSQDHQMVASTEIGLSNLKLSLTAIGSKHRASDALMYDVIKVFRRMKPSSGLSGINFKKDGRRFFLERTYTQVACKAGGLIPLKFSIELRELCCRNWRILRKRSHNAVIDDGRDLKIGSFLTDNETCITLHLIISTDGVKIIHSSGKHLYPLWLIIADLPPVMRFSFDNIALASLWFGDGQADFEVIFQYVQREVSDLKYIYHDGFSYSVRIDFLFLSADNVAKAAILSMKQFNG